MCSSAKLSLMITCTASSFVGRLERNSVQRTYGLQFTVQKMSACAVYWAAGCVGLIPLWTLLLFDTSLWGCSMFSWCNILGSWETSGALSALQKLQNQHKAPILCDWNFDHWKNNHVLFALPYFPFLSLSTPLNNGPSICVSRRIMSSSSSCGELQSLLLPSTPFDFGLAYISYITYSWDPSFFLTCGAE